MSRRFTVALAGLFVLLAPGAVYAFTLLSGPLAAAFGWKPGQANWAFALYSLFIAVGAVYGGRLSDRGGPRLAATIGAMLFSVGYALCGTLTLTPNLPPLLMLFLYYGVIAGTGSGMAYIAAINAAMRWSKTRRGLAGGFVITGFGLGSLVYGTLVRGWGPYASLVAAGKKYNEAYTLAVASNHVFNPTPFLLSPSDLWNLMSLFLYSGGAFLILSAVSGFFLVFPSAENDSAQTVGVSSGEMFSDARFYVLWAMLFLNVFGGSMVIGAAVPIMGELTALPLGMLIALYSGLAVFNGLGRVAFGALSDRLGRRYTFVAIFALQAAAFMALDTVHDPIAVAVAIGALLFAYGGGFGTMPSMVADCFGTRNFGANYGAMLSAWGLAAVLGAYFVNVLKASSGTYIGMMQPLSVLALVALFFPMIVEARQRETHTAVPGAAASSPLPG